MALYHYKRIVRDSDGDVVPSVTVEVNQAGSETNQAIFSDSGGTAKANPFTSDADGVYEFWVVEGAEIDIDFTKTGFSIDSLNNVTIPWITTSVPETRTLTGTDPIQIDGASGSAKDLSADRTISIDESDYALLSGRAGGQTILQGLTVEGGVVINDLGADADFRVEGDSEANLLLVDASTDRVGIGIVPTVELHVSGRQRITRAGTPNIVLEDTTASREWQILVAAADGSFRVRDLTAGAVYPFRMEAGADDISLYIDSSGQVGLGKTPSSKVDIDLATEDLEIVDAGSTGATEQGWIEVEVGGVQGFLRVFAAK